MRSMRRVGGMLGDDGAIGLLRHDEAEKVLTHLIMGVCLKVGDSVFGRYRGCVVGNYCLGLCALNRHSGERCERSAKRKHNF